MHSIRELFKIGNGPSSSHTIGPKRAVLEFKKRFMDIDHAKCILYGSLALTGKGHLTDYIIENTMMPIPCNVEFDILTDMPHPNTMELYGYKNNELVGSMRIYSVGGGAIKIEGDKDLVLSEIYPLNKFEEISDYCKSKGMRLYEYVDEIEDDSFNGYMEDIYETMLNAIQRGLNTTGLLPGSLEIKRKASYLFNQKTEELDNSDLMRKNLMAYAYAVAEENASGGEIVTAPTCGAAGVLPACLGYALDKCIYPHDKIMNALKTAGLIGNIVKKNGSISGAEAGCQAEVGTACSMAAAFLAELKGLSIDKIEVAAEIALEHHLGLTCDPIEGYVQIPCIERNAVAALRALDAMTLAAYLNNQDSKISFDLVVETMLATGKDLGYEYRETSEGGLAKKYR